MPDWKLRETPDFIRLFGWVKLHHQLSRTRNTRIHYIELGKELAYVNMIRMKAWDLGLLREGMS